MNESLRFNHELEQALILIGELESREPINPAARLEALFTELQTLSMTSDEQRIIVLEDLIWDTWTHDEDPELADRMQHAIAAISQQAWGDAEAVLNDLAFDVPGWAEVYNKRAMLYHLVDRDLKSIRDIQRTLKLEPRHFGALSGLGKICIRHDEPVTALFAFDAALGIHPHMTNVRSTANSLRLQVRATMN